MARVHAVKDPGIVKRAAKYAARGKFNKSQLDGSRMTANEMAAARKVIASAYRAGALSQLYWMRLERKHIAQASAILNRENGPLKGRKVRCMCGSVRLAYQLCRNPKCVYHAVKS